MNTTLPSTPRMYQKIAALLRQQIESGQWSAGDALPSERDLAKQLQVSRTSIREAVIALEVSGLVEVKTGSGVYVKQAASIGQTNFSRRPDEEIAPYLAVQEDISPFSLLQARLFIEPEIAALAAENLTEEALLSIKQAYLMNVSDNLMHSTAHTGDRLFHIRIAEACGNDAYNLIVRQLLSHQYGELFTALQRLYTPSDMPMRSQQEHYAILMALEQRDPAAARRHMQTHLQNVIDIFLRGQES